MSQNQDPAIFQELENLQKACLARRDQLLDRLVVYDEVSRYLTFYQSLAGERKISAEQVLQNVSEMVRRRIAATHKEQENANAYLDSIDRQFFDAGLDIMA